MQLVFSHTCSCVAKLLQVSGTVHTQRPKLNCYTACVIKSPSSAHSSVVRGHIEFRVLLRLKLATMLSQLDLSQAKWFQREN